MYYLLILLCTLVIGSYVFSIISRRLKLPAVLFLLTTGIGLKALTAHYGWIPFNWQPFLELFGIVGLVLIVLEGSLELKINREKLPLIRHAFLAALTVLLLTALLIGTVLWQWFATSFYTAFINGLPLAVISSAIAIPSVSNLDPLKKEFIVYESTFSDILGIMLFDFVLHSSELSAGSFLKFGVNLTLVAGLALGCSLLLLWLIQYIKTNVKIYLILSVMMLVYALGKLMHLSSLLIILVFGILMNNYSLIKLDRIRRYLNPRVLEKELRLLRHLTHESAFVIRTFFFVLLGFSIDIPALLHPSVILVGLTITGILFLSRYLCLRFITKVHLFPEVLIAPRGLITILLFYSLPESVMIPEFSKSIVIFVVITSSLCMSIGLLFSPSSYVRKMKEEL